MNFFYRLGYLINRAKFEYARGARDGFSRPTTDKLGRVKAALKDNDSIIAAVKLHRELFGSSLKEAVDTCRAIKDTM